MARADRVARIGITTRAVVLDDEAALGSAADVAINHLFRKSPEYSAAAARSDWLVKFAIGASFAVATLVGLSPAWGGPVAAFMLAVPFSFLILIRSVALFELLGKGDRTAKPVQLLSDDELPSYSVLIPVFDETAIVPALVEAMAAVEYPKDRLQILFITEQEDAKTRDALNSAPLAPCMRVLTVPRGNPQTKPRALNFALQFATGDLVVVYDAEDIPEPDQLRIAATRFAGAPDDLVCLQARLNIYNPGASAITRQFTLEYSALFDAILPSLVRLNLPIPLGGTSNHFRRAKLVEVGAWDPYNVTEDADLGIRFARLGMRVETIPSTTWEEAPSKYRIWHGQRTRWQKGWMQTYGVHMYDPKRLWRELGAWRFFGFQATFGGMILSAIVHPWFYAYAVYALLTGGYEGFGMTPALNGHFLSLFCFGVLVLGYVTGIALVALAVARRGGKLLLRSVIALPIYWLAISYAAYWAIYDLFVRPYYWQKTPHAART